MKKITSIIILIFITSCSFESNKDKQIVLLSEAITNQKLEIEKFQKKNELNAKIERVRTIKSKIIERKLKSDIEKLKLGKDNALQEEQVLILPIKKEIDVKFYSQFPLDIATWIKYDEPYQNFCEEASLLNWYYHLIWKEPSLKEYNNDLLELKEIEDLIFDWWYKHTSIQDTLKLLIAFQEEQEIFWEIVKNPSIQIIKEHLTKWNLIITPLYWKWLSNNLFIGWWPIYHNLIIKGYTEQNFITNEVWVSKWDWFMYKQSELMENIYNYDEKLYPDNFTKWKKEILILYK